jgi:hypothetical protein
MMAYSLSHSEWKRVRVSNSDPHLSLENEGEEAR